MRAVRDLDRDTAAERVADGEPEEHPPLQHPVPVPPAAVPDLPAVEADRHGDGGHDGDGVGRRRLQPDPLHARQPRTPSIAVASSSGFTISFPPRPKFNFFYPDE